MEVAKVGFGVVLPGVRFWPKAKLKRENGSFEILDYFTVH